MSVIHETGILLRSFPYSESSRVMRFLTPGHGLLSVLARGVRRDSSRGKGAIETFDDAELVVAYRAHRDLHTLRDVQVARSRRVLGKHMGRFAGASLVAELVLAHTLQEADAKLHGRVVEVLDRLQKVDLVELPTAVLAGAWGVMVHAGFPPVLDACARCGAALPEDGLLHFGIEAGGLLCPACGATGAGPKLGPGARADLGSLMGTSPPRRVRGAPAHLALLERFALYHLEPSRGLRSVRILRPFLEDSEREQPGNGLGDRPGAKDTENAGTDEVSSPSLDPRQPYEY